MWKYHENIALERLKGRHWHWKVLCFTSPFTSTYLRQTQLLMRQMEAMSLSLFSLDGVCFPTLVFNLLPFFFVLYFCTFDSDSPNESLISFRWCNLSSSLLCVQTGIITKHTAQHTLMKVSGPLHTRGCFHRAQIHLIPSSLLLNPQTGLCEDSLPHIILSH